MSMILKSGALAFQIAITLILTASVLTHSRAHAQDRLVEGRFGQALDAAQGGHVAPANEAYGEFPLTVEFWCNLKRDDSAEGILVSHEAKNSGTHWELITARRTGLLTADLPGFEPSAVQTNARLNDDRWHHVIMILDDKRIDLFVDGRKIESRELVRLDRPTQTSGLGIGMRIEDKRPAEVLIDDMRISRGAREVVGAPEQALVKDDNTISLWSFDESEADYLAKWTPGGETNQRDLPYPHRYAEFEFQDDSSWMDGRWQQTQKGPFLTHSIQLPRHQVGPKNMAVFLKPDESSAVLFDLERCAAVAGVAAGRLKTEPHRFGLLRKPSLEGNVQFYVPPQKTWRIAGQDGQSLEPLSKDELDYQGLSLSGWRVRLRYRVLGGSAVEESTSESGDGTTVIVRQCEFGGLAQSAFLTIAEMPAAIELRHDGKIAIAEIETDGMVRAIALLSSSPRDELIVCGKDVMLAVPKDAKWQVKLLYWAGKRDQLDSFLKLAANSPPSSPLPDFESQPRSRRWGDPLVTHGKLGRDDGRAPFVIDTISIPEKNPFDALFFISGIDFFPGGDAVVSTAHGDVWIVRQINAALDRVAWQRFATGLYQPLGVKVVDNKVIVLGRDQLTRLVDVNDDGEADIYESFNNDLRITGQDHAYAMRLETDPHGNFYFLKSGSEPHGSALLKVSADGSNLSVVARGFRHPYGLGVGPRGEITVADNEGGWVPSSKIDLIREGGFYGFLGNAPQAPDGAQAERPLCFIPKVADNSCGGQIWNTSDQWGNYHRGELLHLSWGRCTLHAVLREQVGETWQAATVRFPGLTFLSGAGAGRFHPVDGQLYVVGLNGWQTGAAADGCFQRVRYTGGKIHMPSQFHVHQNGLRVRFSQPLDGDAADDIANYRVEHWNYRWTSTYGSFHYSVADPKKIGHDQLRVQSAQLSADGHELFLEIPGLQTVDQLHLHTDVRAADGTNLPLNIYATINELGDVFEVPPPESH